MSVIPQHTLDDIAQVNASGLTPVVFIHGLWLLPSSWDRWAEVFKAPAMHPITPGWPDDPETVEEAKEHPEVLAGKTVGQIADHYADVFGKLDKQPAVIGHSFRRPARDDHSPGADCPSRPCRSTRRRSAGCCRCRSRRFASASPVLSNPANRHRAVPLTYEQFRYAFANAVSEDEATPTVRGRSPWPAPGAPLFQAAAANLNPWTEVKVDTENPYRGPLLIISGEKDHTVPPSICEAAFKQQQKNTGVTEFAEIPGRGHSLTIDSGWLEVCNTALAFVQRFSER